MTRPPPPTQARCPVTDPLVLGGPNPFGSFRGLSGGWVGAPWSDYSIPGSKTRSLEETGVGVGVGTGFRDDF